MLLTGCDNQFVRLGVFMRVATVFLLLLFCSQASAAALTEKESVIVSNLVFLRVGEKYCQKDYVFNHKNIDHVVKTLGVNIDDKKYRAAAKKETKLIEGYFKEMGTKMCKPMFDQLGSDRMGRVMSRR